MADYSATEIDANAATKPGQEGLPIRLAEVIELTCTVRMGNDYERSQHERLCARLGLEADWACIRPRDNYDVKQIARGAILRPCVGEISEGEWRIS